MRQPRVAFAMAVGGALAAVAALAAGVPPGAAAGESAPSKGDPDVRAAALVARMTLDEKLSLVHVRHGIAKTGPKPEGALDSAGYSPGVPRLSLPPLQETDGGLGIANPALLPFAATAMPSGLAVAATFDETIAVDAGAAIGAEAHAMGFDVLLGGGADLIREARAGRAFEYASEDPLLTGVIAGAEISGVQTQGIVATAKHYAFNDQENGRILYDARIGEAAARESDLLAFELAVERGRPGAVVTVYNRINGVYGSENAHLISDVLKGDWRFPGWVMSDWGATHSATAAALAGLDVESGEEADPEVFFDRPLRAALADGRVPMARLDDMVRRILRSRIVAGQLDGRPRVDNPTKRLAKADLAAHGAVARRAAEQGIVLLKNAGVLPLVAPRRVLVVGGHADVGVLSGGGSSQVDPPGLTRMEGDPPGLFWGEPRVYHPSPPLAALERALPRSTITFLDGADGRAAAREAKAADVVIVFAEQWSNESRDSPDLALPGEQDALIAALANANPRTIVVFETGHAVTMPWLGAVAGVVEAWYPGARGGEAIADVLTGAVEPSGRLPISFPLDDSQLPRPDLPRREDVTSNPGEPIRGHTFVVDYGIEGADVGYKWDLRRGLTPLFPFGFGLSYTRFAVSGLSAVAQPGGGLSVGFDVANSGARAGIDTPQVYVEHEGLVRRLAGWSRVTLKPGETRHVTVAVDPRLVAGYDEAAHGWHIAAGAYRVSVRDNALADGPAVGVRLDDRRWSARHAADD